MGSTPKKLNWKGAPAPERVTLKGRHVAFQALLDPANFDDSGVQKKSLQDFIESSK